MTKKTNKEIIIGKSLLEKAGLTDFKVTKDDVIDLMVLPHVEEAEQRLQELRNELSQVAHQLQNDKEEAERVMLSCLSRIPTFQTLRACFPQLTPFFRDHYDTIIHFAEQLEHIYSRGAPVIINMELFPTAKKDPEWLQHEVDHIALTKRYNDLSQDIVDVEDRLEELEKAPKKMRAQLVRKVLNGTAEGQQVLSSVDAISNLLISTKTKKLPK